MAGRLKSGNNDGADGVNSVAQAGQGFRVEPPMYFGPWEVTPRLRRLFGKPAFRRRVRGDTFHLDPTDTDWHYSEWPGKENPRSNVGWVVGEEIMVRLPKDAKIGTQITIINVGVGWMQIK